MRRQFRTRHPIVESIIHHNINVILKDEWGIRKKARCKRFTYDDINEWNWFIDHSTTTKDRGKLFNLQMCLYLRNILNHDEQLNTTFEMKFYETGSHKFLS